FGCFCPRFSGLSSLAPDQTNMRTQPPQAPATARHRHLYILPTSICIYSPPVPRDTPYQYPCTIRFSYTHEEDECPMHLLRKNAYWEEFGASEDNWMPSKRHLKRAPNAARSCNTSPP